ncbi:MAG: 5-methylthioadenosine/S-adenosylhomocysteine deaminase [Actinomycetota bacterium]|nr:5-methylthioadenosine/S-adenosylhomocysteine deaminase [Actinomycetota bacterium]
MTASPRNLAVTNAVLDGEPVSLTVEDGLITSIGPDVDTDGSSTETLDARGGSLCPPLINGHTHAAMTLFRGHGDDLPLMRWLQEAIWPVEANLEAEDVYWGTRLACLEMIRGGTIGFWDMYWQPEATARAVEDAGLRAVIGPPVFDPPDGDFETRNRTLEEQLRNLEGFGDHIQAAVAPHAIYTNGTAGLEYATGLARDRDLPIHIHLSETEQEVIDCVKAHGMRPAFYLDDLGMLSEQATLAHGVWLDREELELIADRGATVTTNPVANMKLAVAGAFPCAEASRAGVSIALGTDGAGSNNSLDLLADLKVFALIQRHTAADAEAIPMEEAWAIATGRRSSLIGGLGRPGIPASDPLTVGAPADFIVLDPDVPELALGNLTSSLVYSASSSAVKDTVVDGRILMENREVEGHTEILDRARERSTRLGLS